MDFRFSEEDETFRRELRAFLTAEWPGATGDASVDNEEEYRQERAFEKKLAGRGWLTLAWPVEYGGRGASHIRQAIMKEEGSYFRAPIGGGGGGRGRPGDRAGGPGDHGLRHGGAEAPLPAAHCRGRGLLVPGVLGAECRLRSGFDPDAGGARP